MSAANFIPLAKIMDAWGRAEGFFIMTVFATLGLVLMAACQSLPMFCAAYVFYSIGFGGMTYCVDVITSDASKLKNRGLAYAFTSSPYIITAFAAPKASDDFYHNVSWRWGFDCFTIIFPVVAAPLYCLLLKYHVHKAGKQGMLARNTLLVLLSLRPDHIPEHSLCNITENQNILLPSKMYSKSWPKGGLPGLLHHYTESLIIFEYTPTATAHKPHSLLFIGGLGDGLATTTYMADLVRALQPTDYSVFTLNLTSSYQSCGLGHLDRDTNEIAQCVRYIKEYKNEKFGPGKIVLMGHLTGIQCVLHYLYRDNPHVSMFAFDRDLEHVQRLVVDGAIMQAPVSDREAIQWVLKGRLAVLISGADQSIPDWVAKDSLLSKWRNATDSKGPAIWDQDYSGIIPNASHALSNDDQTEPRKLLVSKVRAFYSWILPRTITEYY